MLGIFYLLVNTIGLTTGYIKDNMINDNAKKQGYELYNRGQNRAGVYIDSQGRQRDLKTDHKVFTYRDKNRDLIVKDLKTGEEKNLDRSIRKYNYEKEKQEAIKRAKENGGIALFGKFSEKENNKSFLNWRDRYVDIYGNLYIKKYIIWNLKTMGLSESNRIGCFYMNIKTNKIDYVEIINPGEVFKHCSTHSFPYNNYDMLYANSEEIEKYKCWYNNNCNTEEQSLKYIGKFYISDYKNNNRR